MIHASSHGVPACPQRILVVDDDSDIRNSVRDLLEFEGFHVVTAENGRAALERLREMGSPCLILLDLMMPVMDGWTFLELVKRDKDSPAAGIPVAVVSALDDADELKAIYQCEVFRKPIDIDRLIDTARQHCGLN